MQAFMSTLRLRMCIAFAIVCVVTLFATVGTAGAVTDEEKRNAPDVTDQELGTCGYAYENEESVSSDGGHYTCEYVVTQNGEGGWTWVLNFWC